MAEAEVKATAGDWFRSDGGPMGWRLDVVTLLAQGGLFMDHLPTGADDATWRRYADGQRGPAVAALSADIPADALDHIFERFYRVDKARSRQAGGSGLGLSIVHDLVERNFGEIQVECPEEGGTRFTVTFPYFDMEVAE